MKCTKVKNPCKICFQPVSKKTGLRCQGACQKWAHYKCLNYTPGKISDIKAGIIVVTCPCPDCDTAEPKEVLKDPPYTCTNTQCPANKLPICESTECPSKNTIKNTSPIPAYPPPPMEYSPAQSQQQCASNEPPKKTNKCNVKASSSGLSLKMQRRPPSPKPCNTCPNKSFSPKQSQSCSNMSANSCDSDIQHSDNLRTFSSDSHLSNVDHKMLFSALESLCNTVGQLSTQLKDIVCKMKEVAIRT